MTVEQFSAFLAELTRLSRRWGLVVDCDEYGSVTLYGLEGAGGRGAADLLWDAAEGGYSGTLYGWGEDDYLGGAIYPLGAQCERACRLPPRGGLGISLVAGSGTSSLDFRPLAVLDHPPPDL